MKDEIILEAKAIASGLSNHAGRLVQLTKELIEIEKEGDNGPHD